MAQLPYNPNRNKAATGTNCIVVGKGKADRYLVNIRDVSDIDNPSILLRLLRDAYQ